MTEQHFQTHLEQSPNDWGARLVYADWLEERGESIRANGQRWQVENGKHAQLGYVASKPPREAEEAEDETFNWWNAPKYRWTPLKWQVSIEIFGFLWDSNKAWTGDFRRQSDSWVGFKTRQTSETALANALHKLGIKSNCNSVTQQTI